MHPWCSSTDLSRVTCMRIKSGLDLKSLYKQQTTRHFPFVGFFWFFFSFLFLFELLTLVKTKHGGRQEGKKLLSV